MRKLLGIEHVRMQHPPLETKVRLFIVNEIYTPMYENKILLLRNLVPSFLYSFDIHPRDKRKKRKARLENVSKWKRYYYERINDFSVQLLNSSILIYLCVKVSLFCLPSRIFRSYNKDICNNPRSITQFIPISFIKYALLLTATFNRPSFIIP